MVGSPRVTCTYHCRACGGENGTHFHSLKAFDAHRVGDYGSNDPETRRRCLHPIEVIGTKGKQKGEPLLIALSESAVCQIGPGPDKEGITVWTFKSDVERLHRDWNPS